MIKYFKMKQMEIKMKLMFYESFFKIMNEKQEILDFIQRAYTSLKDVPAEELQHELISCVATLAHEQAVKERGQEKENNNA